MRNEYLESLQQAGLSMHPTLSGAPMLGQIRGLEGLTWDEYRERLTPRYWVVWRDIALNLCMLGTGMVFFLVNPSLPLWTAMPGALWFGFWWHAVFTFLHESAHYNLAPTHRLNDILSNILLMPMFGVDISSYRDIHWKHHFMLGDDGDTEISYINPITLLEIAAEFGGANAVRSILRYLNSTRADDRNGEAKAKSRMFLVGPGLLAITQSSIIAALLWFSGAAAALAWLGAFLILTPLYNKVRQTLEHRSMYAGKRRLLSPAEQGPLNRTFGNGLFARKFGDAGFHRHMLHHWQPTLSYTRLGDMEAFFQASDLRDVLAQNESTYLRTLLLLAN